MATDEKDPKPGASRSGKDPSDSGAMERFVDRDDDRSSAFIDSDYSEEFPDPGPDLSEDADPGYAAFASELEDPLADWPSPDVSIEQLPEMRRRNEPDVAFGSSDPFAVQDNKDADVGDDMRLRTDAIEDVLTPPSAGDMLFDDADDDGDLALGPDVVDGDSLPPEPFDPGVATPVAATTAATVPVEPEIADPPDELAVETDEPLAQSNDPFAVTGDPPDDVDDGLFDKQEQTFEDEFVDDFLNDLDPPEEDDYEIEEYSRAAEDFDDDDIPGAAAMAANSVLSESSVERATPYRSDDMNSGPRAGASAAAADNDGPEEERSLPIAMIAVVLVALLLLGIGGYGVVQQRGQMQAEIRELQARLATTITPEEAEAERERQRQVQLENESLSAELEGLTAENSALAQQLEQIEATLAEQEEQEQQEQREAQARQAAADAQAAAARSARQAAASSTGTAAASGAGAAPAGGPWFVNFGSYADRGIADRWAGKLSVDEGRVVVQSASAAGKTLYRVRVIGLGNQDAAERVATALERQYQLPRLWVGKS